MHIDSISLLHHANIFIFTWALHEAKRLTTASHARCTTDSIDILLDLTRQIKVQHPRDIFEVETARCNIRADKRTLFIFVEASIGDFALRMVHITMQLVHKIVI